MKIALIAPLYEAVPPKLYGGTERIVAFLADELVARGHEVSLFASGDSSTKAKLINCRDRAYRLDDSRLKSDVAAHLSMLDEVRKRAAEFDILHFHVDLLPAALFEHEIDRTLSTLHGRLDLVDLKDFYRRWPHYPLVSISDSQRRLLPKANWAGTVYHGLPLNLFKPAQKPRADYLAFLGRISPEKRPDIAIDIAQRANRKIRIAAKIEELDLCYYRKAVEPKLSLPGVEYVGEVDESDKNDFLTNAEALLMPVEWPEPFGLVLIEAMACGTPVIAFNWGAIPELVEDGVTGFIVENEEQAVAALDRLGDLDRRRIRAEFERRFSAGRMAEDYLALYQQVSAGGRVLAASALDNSNVSHVDVAPEAIDSNGEAGADDARMPYKLYALKHKDTFVVADSFGDIVGSGDGLFRNDTRVLSEFRLRLSQKPLSLLSATVSQDNVYFAAHVTNRPLPPLGGRSIPEGVIHIKRSRFLWDECLYERLELVNYGEQEINAPISVHFGADFRDMFEVRGIKRAKRGEQLKPVLQDHSALLSYRGLDGVVRNSCVAFSEQPNDLTAQYAAFNLHLPCNKTVELYMEIGPAIQGGRPSRQRFRDAAAKARRSMRKRGHGGGTLRSAERVFNNWLEKSRADLALLTTELDTGPYPYAGIPWFSTPFGRDAVITAMQMLWFEPSIARGVLNFLAHHQARETSSFRDSAPGKVMHETRKGEMNLLQEIPFGLYYGGVDTTPLFVMLAGAYANRTADLPFIESIWPALETAMHWIEEIGDSNGDGFLDYASGEATGLRNQGWKDSEDSVFYEDGQFPKGPIALVEVQGYKFAALIAIADLAERRGDLQAAQTWRERAEALRAKVEQRFWMDDKEFYALALDGDGKTCRVRASNAGHLLFTGLPSADRADRVIHQLLHASFDSGWGIRTLATDEARYNPMSYHNGSVWPHDTAICAAGMARYGNRSGASHVLSELFDAAVHFGMRLPELFCGFQRLPGESPIAYPVACLPQAWASGSVFMTLQASLGVRIDGWDKTIYVDRPELPAGINHLSIRGVPLGNTRIDLSFQRVRDRVAVFTNGKNSQEVKVLSYV